MRKKHERGIFIGTRWAARAISEVDRPTSSSSLGEHCDRVRPFATTVHHLLRAASNYVPHPGLLNLSVLKWPSQSPDPTEPLWNVVEQESHIKDDQLTNLKQPCSAV